MALRSEGYDGDHEIVNVNGVRGILVNKREIDNYRGEIPLSQYKINTDPNPLIIPKTLDEPIKAKQQVTIRYLEPLPQPPPGPIIIQREKPIFPPPAPPLVIRELNQAKPLEPKVIREAPPKYPPPEGRKIIKLLPPKVDPPPRKVIIEKLPALEEQTQPIIIERWLAAKPQPRRVVLEGSELRAEQLRPEPVRNEIIKYEAPRVLVSQEIKGSDVVRMDPNEYYARYRDQLVDTNNLPQYARDIRAPPGFMLASDPESRRPAPLEGDVHVLSSIDLDREGLGEYKIYVTNRNPPVSSPQSTTNYGTSINSSTNRDGYPAGSGAVDSGSSIGHMITSSSTSGNYSTNANAGSYPSSNSSTNVGGGYATDRLVNSSSPTARVSWNDQYGQPASYEVRTTTFSSSSTTNGTKKF